MIGDDFAQAGDLVAREVALTRMLRHTGEALRGVVMAHAPTDREIEHLADHLTDPVRANRGRLPSALFPLLALGLRSPLRVI